MPNNDENISVKIIYDEILKSRSELKNSIEASEARVLLKIESIKNKVASLEKENEQLKTKIESLERQNKKNNIIIFGITKPAQETTPEYICNKLNTLLEIDLIKEDISDIFSLGKGDNRPIKVEFLSHLRKTLVILNSHKLKGKGISISHDLTTTQREEHKVLRGHLMQARQNTENTCYIKGNRLVINNIPYTTDQLQQLQNLEANKKEKPASAPPTPTITNDTQVQQWPTYPKEDNKAISEEKEIQKTQESNIGTPKSVLSKQLTKISMDPTKEKTRTRSTTSQKK